MFIAAACARNVQVWLYCLCSSCCCVRDPKQCEVSVQWNFFRVNETGKTQAICNLCNGSICKKFQHGNDVIDRIGELRHYGRSHKLHKMQNIGRSDIADQIGGKPIPGRDFKICLSCQCCFPLVLIGHKATMKLNDFI